MQLLRGHRHQELCRPQTDVSSRCRGDVRHQIERSVGDQRIRGRRIGFYPLFCVRLLTGVSARRQEPFKRD